MATRTELADSNGRNIGHTIEEGDRINLYKTGGYCLGYFDKSTNTTHKTGGAMVGRGNVLLMLMK